MSEKILLVEDEALLAMSTVKMLEKHRFEVVTAHNGEKAVEIVEEDPEISLILMDIDLGRAMDGTETAQKILEEHDIPIVFLTSHSEKEYVDRVKKITNYGFVLKNSGEFVLNQSINMAFQLFESHNRIAQSEEKHRTLFETMAQGVVYFDAHGAIISANPASEKMLGLSFDQMNGKTSMDSRWKMITDDGEEVPVSEYPSMVALRRTGENVGPVTRGVFVPERGEYVWLLITAIPLFKPGEDKPFQVYVTFNDISEKKRADDALKESRDKIASILKASPTGIGVVQGREKRTIVEANEKLCLMTGYSRDELIGRSARTLYPSQENFDYVGSEKYRQIDTGGSGSVETRWKKKDGTIIEVLLASSPIHPADISLGVTFTAMDITERKQAEASLRKSENLFKKVFEILPIGLWIADKNGKLVHGNPAGVKIWGKEPKVDQSKYGVFKARRLPSGEEIAPEDWALAHTINKGVTIVDELLEIEAFDRKKKIILNYTAPILNSNEEIEGAIVVNQDITERKLAEERIQKAIKEKDYLMKELNHRVKNNLAMVSSLISLKDSETDEDLSDLKHRIDVIKLVHEKLRQQSDTEQIDGREYLQELLEAIFSFTADRSVHIVNNIMGMASIPTRTAIPLGLVVNEIATNAIKYGFTSDKEARFTIEMKKDSEKQHYILTLSNTGNPFPEEIGLENPSTMGLQLVTTLVKQLNGTIELQKKPNPVFTIEFPVET